MNKFNPISILVLSLILSIGCNNVEEGVLYYEETGEGETILFVHGSQEDFRIFKPQLELLGEEYRIITYSRRYNYPNNQLYKEGTLFDPMTEAEDLEKLRQDIGIDKFHIVGHSYGGLIAIAYANKYNNRLNSITVSEPPLLNIQGCSESIKMAKSGLLEPLKSSFKTKDTTLVLKTIFEFFVGADIQDQVPSEVLDGLKANLPEMEALSNSSNPFPSFNSTFDFPTMIITSENVMPILKCTNESLIRLTPNAKHVEIPGTSHDMWMSHPEILSMHLKEFIEKI